MNNSMKNGNSIRDNLSSKDVATEVRLMINAGKNVILVEGKDDIKLIRKFVENEVVVKESFDSKKGVIEIKDKFKDFIKVIGIIDRDYDIDRTYQEGIFTYDFSSMEIMMINDVEIFSNICNEYLDDLDKIKDKEELKKEMLLGLLPISLFRKINNDKQLGIKINNVSINEILLENKKVSVEKLFELIDKRNISNKSWKDKKESIKKEIVELLDESYELKEILNITRGHDFIKLFGAYCCEGKGKKYGIDVLQGSLRCSFSFENFRKTNLYLKVDEYSRNKNIKLFRKMRQA